MGIEKVENKKEEIVKKDHKMEVWDHLQQIICLK
jgi:hypothetical protein